MIQTTGKTKNEILIEIYNDKTYQTICKAFTKKKDWEDLYSIFLTIICGKTEEKLKDVYYNHNVEYMQNYCCQILVNQYYSSASTFYYQCRKYNLTHKNIGNVQDNIANEYDIEDDNGADTNILNFQSEKQVEEIMNQLNSVVDSQHWYNTRLFRLWLEKGSVRKVEADFKKNGIKISKSAIQKSVKQTKTIIKNQLKNPFKDQ